MCFPLCLGQLLLAKGELEQASAAFRIVLDGDRDNVSALLGQVCFCCLNLSTGLLSWSLNVCHGINLLESNVYYPISSHIKSLYTVCCC